MIIEKEYVGMCEKGPLVIIEFQVYMRGVLFLTWIGIELNGIELNGMELAYRKGTV